MKKKRDLLPSCTCQQLGHPLPSNNDPTFLYVVPCGLRPLLASDKMYIDTKRKQFTHSGYNSCEFLAHYLIIQTVVLFLIGGRDNCSFSNSLCQTDFCCFKVGEWDLEMKIQNNKGLRQGYRRYFLFCVGSCKVLLVIFIACALQAMVV